jgi:hypothetical protein
MGNVFQWSFNAQKLFDKSQSRIVNCDKIKAALQLAKMPVNTQAAVFKTIEYYNSIKI